MKPQTSTDAGHSLSSPETWVDRHGDILFRFAVARLRNRVLAEEAVQETLLAALKARERYSGKAPEQTWLIGILKHKIIDQIRKRAKEIPDEHYDAWPAGLNELYDSEGAWDSRQGAAPSAWGNAEAALREKEFRTALKDCIDKLPGRIADVFVLREMDDLDTKEICKLSNITPTNLWVMLHRARAQLRRCLEMNWFESHA